MGAPRRRSHQHPLGRVAEEGTAQDASNHIRVQPLRRGQQEIALVSGGAGQYLQE